MFPTSLSPAGLMDSTFQPHPLQGGRTSNVAPSATTLAMSILSAEPCHQRCFGLERPRKKPVSSCRSLLCSDTELWLLLFVALKLPITIGSRSLINDPVAISKIHLSVLGIVNRKGRLVPTRFRGTAPQVKSQTQRSSSTSSSHEPPYRRQLSRSHSLASPEPEPPEPHSVKGKESLSFKAFLTCVIGHVKKVHLVSVHSHIYHKHMVTYHN